MNGAGHTGGNAQSVPVYMKFHQDGKDNSLQRGCKIKTIFVKPTNQYLPVVIYE